MKSESGLIKIPGTLLHDVNHAAMQLLLSYAYHKTRLDRNVEKFHNTILKIMAVYKITPIDEHEINNMFKVRYDDSNLPDSYRKYERPNSKTVFVKIDHQEKRFLGGFLAPNLIVVATQILYNILIDPSKDADALYAVFADFSNTIEHELTHYMQITYLHEDNMKRDGNMLVDSKYDKYYTSQIEFDPTIKSNLSTFAQLVYDKFPDGKFDFNRLVGRFTLSKESPNEHTDPNLSIEQYKQAVRENNFPQSSFFDALKRLKPDAYKKALSLFVANVHAAYDEYKSFKDNAQKLEVKRHDSVFCNLRRNEFAHFVQMINTFITFPESRLADFESMKKYLDRIDVKFKQARLDCQHFVTCNEQAISVIKAGKSFSIKTIFVNVDIKNTGMLFDIFGLPMILDIDMLTHDQDYQEACDQHDIKFVLSMHDFAIVDGSNFKFNRDNLVATYINGKQK